MDPEASGRAEHSRRSQESHGAAVEGKERSVGARRCRIGGGSNELSGGRFARPGVKVNAIRIRWIARDAPVGTLLA
jgi:hypothetical protein